MEIMTVCGVAFDKNLGRRRKGDDRASHNYTTSTASALLLSSLFGRLWYSGCW